MKFCNIIDWDGFVNMSMLKSPTMIIVGQFLNWYFLKCSFQNRNEITYFHFGWFVNCNYMQNVLCIFIKSCNIINYAPKFVIEVVSNKQIVS